ncbi:MAG: TolC family protein, partial [Gammaproteobacteria bacterium]|nr:TolC family protein [Gammaproteobacteria bacterium]
MRYIEKYLISCGIVLLVTACASPDSLPPPTHEEVVQEALPETTEIAVTWGEFTTEGSVQDGWIATFNDQKLVQIVDEVLKNNRDIAVAAANVEVAAGLATQAGAQLAPAVAVGGGAQTANRGGTDTNVAGAALNIEWELDIWGKLGSEAAAATETFRASQANFEFARQS